MSANTTPVREYHNGLAQHLLDLIRKSTSALASSSASASPDTTPRTRKTQVVTPPPPANPRQHSDSSLDSNSKVSSGQTTQSRKSSVERTEHSTVDEEGEEEERGRIGSNADATSERNDMTARPDVHPPRFPSIPQFNVEDAPQDGEAYTEAESSATGARRHAAASRPSPSSTSPTNDSGKISRSRISTYPTTYAEHLTREAEHRKAWETTGRKVWRNMPVNFELKLAPIDLKQKKKARSGSNESNSHSHSASDISGAGPGTAIRADDVFVPELDGEQEHEQERMSSSNPTNIETVSEVSRNDRGEGESGGGPMPSESSVSMSIAKPTIKRRSTLQRRQARVEAEAQAHAEAEAAVEHPEQSHDPEPEAETEPDTQPGSEDEQAEYARKREMRLRKKEQALKKRIGTWWAGVSEHSTPASSAAITPPEIEPHIPSPKLEYAGYGDRKSMLRFPPLPTSMPDFIGGDSPMLTLPSLQLIEDGRRNRPGFEPLNVDMGSVGKTTDIDLLIRLTEMSRLSSPSATAAAAAGSGGAGRARFPSAPPAHSSGGLISGDRIETHSFNVRGSTTTPKPKPAMRSVFSGFGSQI